MWRSIARLQCQRDEGLGSVTTVQSSVEIGRGLPKLVKVDYTAVVLSWTNARPTIRRISR